MNNSSLLHTENEAPSNVRPGSAPLKTPSKKSIAAFGSSTPTARCASASNTKKKKTSKAEDGGTPVSSREAAILAKQQHTAEKQKRTSMLKEKWAKEKQEKKEMIEKKREEDLKRLQKLSKLHSQQRQKCMDKSNRFRQSQKEQQRELLKSSITDNIEAKKKIEAMEKERRRQSILVNKEILSRAKKNQSKIQRKKKEDEDSLHMSRRIDFLSVREEKLKEEEKRRESLQQSNAYHRMQRELDKELEDVKKENMQDILSVRKEMHEDDVKAANDLKAKRRQSLIGRLDAWRSQRKVEDDLQKKQQEELQLDIIQRHEDWLDIQEAKQEYKERARQSVLWRLDKWRETKDLEAEAELQKRMAEENERELFLQEYEDVMQYKQEQEDIRRQSLAYRLDQASREKEWERGEEYVLQAEAENERKIKAQDRQDVERYKNQLKEDRRASLAFRLEEYCKDREFYAGQTANQKELMAKENQLKLEDQRAVNAYKEELKRQERSDIAMSIAESQKQKERALVEHQKKLDAMHEDFLSKTNDWLDIKEYQAKEKERRRQSICMRLDSWRQQRLKNERRKARQKRQEERDAEARRDDYLAVRNAKAQEALDEKAKNIKCFL